MIRRIIYTTSDLKCCRESDDDVVYTPSSRKFIFNEDKLKFTMKLHIWKDKFSKLIKKMVKQLADDECSGMGTPYLCYFNFIVDKVEELILEEIPEELYVTKKVERVLKMRDRGSVHIYGLNLKEFNKRMSDLDYTHNQAAELIRLYKLGIVKTK